MHVLASFSETGLYCIVSVNPRIASSVHIITKKGYTSCAGHFPPYSQIHSCPFRFCLYFRICISQGLLTSGFWEGLAKGSPAGLCGSGKEKWSGILCSPPLLLVASLALAVFPPRTSSHGIIIPLYFRSHKTATESSSSHEWFILSPGSTLPCRSIHPSGDNSFLLKLRQF